MPLQRPCLDCGQLTGGRESRCEPCRATKQRDRDQRRGNSRERGYGHAHRVRSRTVLDRDNHVCHWCGREASTVDHVRPKVLGGTDDLTNLVAACRSCNSARTARTRRGGFAWSP
jgi:5-methylcytosine-specific restriction endonuclease McrA